MVDESRHFPAERGSVAAVRRFVREALATIGVDNVEDGVLLAGEVAANVVEHAQTDYQVRVSERSGRPRVEVTDGSAVLPAVRDLADDADRGRGLLLLDRLARAWGVEERPGGKCVWFELEPTRDSG